MAKHTVFIGSLILVLPFLIVVTEATEYNVGGSFGWNIPPNQTFYSDWAASKSFFVGDSLVFNLTNHQGFADVTMADYKNCNFTNITPVVDSLNGTIFTVPLLHPGPRYFISSRVFGSDDSCARGQKFSIDVKSSPFSSSPSPSAQPPSFYVPALYYGVLPAFLSTIAVYFL